MPTVAEPDEIADALNAPTLDDKTTPIKKMAESKVSLDADAVPVRSVPHPHTAHSRLSIPGLPCPIHRSAVELAVTHGPTAHPMPLYLPPTAQP